ncbi:acetylxylan esterase [Microbacterium sp. 11MF]|uniref:acetylxylan esterase n=1 Tax=Microbacterium sp. 11MF TaxID=1169146 RepID=UPI00036012B4|nr:acetylxylan esterase [Microbacterium sp. 11MF]
MADSARVDEQMQDLGPIAGYPDWPAFLEREQVPTSGSETRRILASVLGVRRAVAGDVRVEREWRSGGVHGRELSWQLPYGPRTRAWVLRPDDDRRGLPGLLGLHCHGGVRSVGAEQLLETDQAPHPSASRLRENVYGGLAPANDLARDGFVVLAQDTFSWGSRAFDLSHPTPRLAGLIAGREALWREEGVTPTEAERFDAVASLHEDSLAKAAGMLGTSLAGAVMTEDVAALDVLAGLDDVDAERLGTFGLSGGGGRAVMLRALDDRVRATVVTCMMATFASLVPREIDTHSWLLNSPGIRAAGDLPEIAASASPRELLVQYGAQDPLFPIEGMRDADRALAGTPGYRGTFFDDGHVSSPAMQDEARAFFAATLTA